MEPVDLTPGAIIQIAWDVIEGTAEKSNAEALLALFCDCVDNRQPVPRDLAVHLRDSFRRYLADEKTIGAALGLAKKKGRPMADQELPIKMATEVLRLRMKKVSHEGALANVSGKFRCGVTAVSDAWRKHQQDAIISIRLERHLDKFPWTAREMDMLDSIFAGKSWYITTSGKSAIKPE